MRFCLVIIAVLGLPGCSTSDSISDRQTGQIIVCHNGKSIAVSNADMFVHESHGDLISPCPSGN